MEYQSHSCLHCFFLLTKYHKHFHAIKILFYNIIFNDCSVFYCIFIHTIKYSLDEHWICFHGFTITNHFAMNFFIIPSLCTFIFFMTFLEEKLISKSICTVESLFMSIIYYLPPEVYESVCFSARLGFGFYLNFMLLITVHWVNLWLKEHWLNDYEMVVFFLNSLDRDEHKHWHRT